MKVTKGNMRASIFVMQGWILTAVISFVLFQFLVMIGKVMQKRRLILQTMARQGIESPLSQFLFGHAAEFSKLRATASDNDMSETSNNIVPRLLPFHHKYTKLCGSTFLYWWGFDPMLQIMDPQMVYEVLCSKFSNFQKSEQQRKYMEPLFGAGLAMAIGKQWLIQRRIASPAFHQDKIKMMSSTISQSVIAVISRWQEAVELGQGCAEIEVHSELTNMGAEIIALAAFGSECDYNRYITLQRRLQELLFSRPLWCILPGYSHIPTSSNKEMSRVDYQIRGFLGELIEKRLSCVRENKSTSYGEDILGMMLSATDSRNAKLSQKLLMDECKTFFFAGHETTSSLLTWTMFLLAVHPEWQEKAYDEIEKNSHHGDFLDHGATTKLKIVTMIMNESLRLYPPAIQVSREALANVEITGANGNKLFIPKGVSLHIPILSIHHDPQLWGSDVLLFRPDRFAQGVAKASKHPMAYFPFGMGPRVCVGQTFAIAEAKVALCMFLHHFKWSLSPNYRHAPISGVTLYPAHGMQLLVSSRHL